MRYGLNEFVRVPKHLVRDFHDKAQSEDEALHLFFPRHFHAEFFPQSLVVFVCTSSRGHDLDASLHDFQWHSMRFSRR